VTTSVRSHRLLDRAARRQELSPARAQVREFPDTSGSTPTAWGTVAAKQQDAGRRRRLACLVAKKSKHRGNGKAEPERRPKTSAGDVPPEPRKKLKRKMYEAQLEHLQHELVKLQEYVRHTDMRVVILFEGRDAAGKGGVIKRIADALNPRVCRVVALGTPTTREKSQWYFQRYVAELPAAGEIVLFDRSWYNRAGVERVMGFCTEDELEEFFRSCPEFERMLVRSGLVLIKYWFSVSDDVQERRFLGRIDDPKKRWKLSPMDLEARARWVEYSKAKDEMFKRTDIREAPWWVVPADDKKRARLNCISHILSSIAYDDLTPEPIKLPKRQKDTGYVRPPEDAQNFIPANF
jgi:polyphosphate kinase 2